MTLSSPLLVWDEFSHMGRLKSSASLACCYVCGKGLEEGHSISAKALPEGMGLFCNIHYPD